MAGGILRCSEVAHGPLKDSQFLHLSRLLLLFDYVMKHLYDAPSSLLEQVTINFFLQVLYFIFIDYIFRWNGIYFIQHMLTPIKILTV